MKWNNKILTSITIMLVLFIGIILTWGSAFYNFQTNTPPAPTIVTDIPIEEVREVEKEESNPQKEVTTEREEDAVVHITLEDGLTVELLRKLKITETNISIDRLLSILDIK
ncbi:hypothetical protein [Bacillus alkalisoli]|uniref:hypothetical protein n=1 Tax=Bacillus alkalisoli TaxID=2011008 RepID=UPI0012FF124C|nr:hypothetical protein [Bacillus alkalisoli]